jgi:hypothetical protein
VFTVKDMFVNENDERELHGTVKNEKKWKNVKNTGTLDRSTKITRIDIKSN